MRFTDLASFFTAKDNADPIKLASWRERVALSLAAIVLLFMLAPVGIEFRYVDKAEAEEAHAVIENRLQGVEDQLMTLSDQAKAAAIRDTRIQIWELRERACMSTGELRTVLNGQVNDLRTSYRALTGEEFPVIPCIELVGVELEEE